MRAAIACVLLPTLLGAAPEAGLRAEDHVYALAQTWSCRTMRGAETHKTGTRTGDRVDVLNDVHPAGAPAYVLNDRYGFDPATAQWHVVLGTGSPIAIEAIAPPWTGATWELTGRQIGGAPARVTYELFSDQDMRRKIGFLSGGAWRLSGAERCIRGEESPPANVCIASNAPSHLVSFAPLDFRTMPTQTPDGTVEIVIHLDEQSQVRSTTTIQSPSQVLTAAFLQSVRASTFQTEIRDCRSVASDYKMRGTVANNRFTLQY
jgi:hypothetical protein